MAEPRTGDANGPLYERRREGRRRARLRPGRLLAEDGRFLCDCAIVERSAAGARIRAFAGRDLPASLLLFDEGEAVKWRVRLAWRLGSEAGLGFVSPGAVVGRPEELRRLAGRYYALG